MFVTQLSLRLVYWICLSSPKNTSCSAVRKPLNADDDEALSLRIWKHKSYYLRSAVVGRTYYMRISVRSQRDQFRKSSMARTCSSFWTQTSESFGWLVKLIPCLNLWFDLTATVFWRRFDSSESVHVVFIHLQLKQSTDNQLPECFSVRWDLVPQTSHAVMSTPQTLETYFTDKMMNLLRK